MQNVIKNLVIPEANIIRGAIAGVIVFGVVHGLAYFGIVLTADQASSLSVQAATAAAFIVAHLSDVVDKSQNPSKGT